MLLKRIFLCLSIITSFTLSAAQTNIPAPQRATDPQVASVPPITTNPASGVEQPNPQAQPTISISYTQPKSTLWNIVSNISLIVCSIPFHFINILFGSTASVCSLISDMAKFFLSAIASWQSGG